METPEGPLKQSPVTTLDITAVSEKKEESVPGTRASSAETENPKLKTTSSEKATSSTIMRNKGFTDSIKKQAVFKLLQVEDFLQKANQMLLSLNRQFFVLSMCMIFFNVLSLALAFNGLSENKMGSAAWWNSLLNGTFSFIAALLQSILTYMNYGGRIENIEAANIKMPKVTAKIDTVLNSRAENMPEASEFIEYINRKLRKYHALVPWIPSDYTYTSMHIKMKAQETELRQFYNANDKDEAEVDEETELMHNTREIAIDIDKIQQKNAALREQKSQLKRMIRNQKNPPNNEGGIGASTLQAVEEEMSSEH